jgi:hypothetical protein
MKIRIWSGSGAVSFTPRNGNVPGLTSSFIGYSGKIWEEDLGGFGRIWGCRVGSWEEDLVFRDGFGVCRPANNLRVVRWMISPTVGLSFLQQKEEDRPTVHQILDEARSRQVSRGRDRGRSG